jgi:tetratricopeptide (TPR) repeat protein
MMSADKPHPGAMRLQQSLDLALQHHQAGRLAEAEAIYRRILALQPENSDALNLLGVIASQKGEHRQAVELIKRAISINPRDSAYQNNLGNVFKDLSRLDEAITAYNVALQLASGNVEAWNNLGSALNTQGRHQEAVFALHSALQINPGYAEAHHNLGNAQTALGLLDSAIASFQTAIKIRPGLAQSYSNLANTLRRKGELSQAEAACRTALKIRPDYAEACNTLGVVLHDQGRIEEAMAAFRATIQIKPDMVEAFLNLDLMDYEGRLSDPIFLLRCPPSILSTLGDIRLTRNGACGSDGVNVELAGIMSKPFADLKIELRKYLTQERAKLKNGTYLTLYHPQITIELIRSVTDVLVLEVKGNTVEEIFNAIPQQIKSDKILPFLDHRRDALSDATAIQASFPPQSCIFFHKPKSKIAVLTLWTKEIEEYAQLTIPNNLDYCKKNRYDFIAHYGKIDPSRPAAWSKIPLILDYIRDYEWCMWIDADAAFINKSITLEILLEDYKGCDMVISGEVSNICSGVFILKNSDAAIKMLEAAYSKTQYIKHRWWEQIAIIDVLRDKSCGVKVGYIPKNRINSGIHDYKAGDFIIHTPYVPNRHKILRKYIRP